MQNSEPVYTQEDTDIMLKILNSIYAKAGINKLANNATQTNSEEITLLLILLKEFEELFDGTLGDWSTDPVNLELKTYSKLFNSRYYPVPRINKETFWKELKRLVEIGVITSLQ